MPTTVQHKRGDSFAMGVAWAEGGSPLSLTGCAIASQARTSAGALVANFEVTARNNAAGTVTLAPAAGYESSRWPIEAIRIDVQLTRADGTIISTETFLVDVVRDETQ